MYIYKSNVLHVYTYILVPKQLEKENLSTSKYNVIHTCICKYNTIHIYIYIYIYMYIYTYMHTYTHTRIHTHIYASSI